MTSNTADLTRWIDACTVAEKAGDFPALLRAGENILRLAPDRPQGYYIRAFAHQHLRQYDEAIDYYRQLLSIDPTYESTWNNLGFCYQAVNEVDAAEICYRRAIELAGEEIADIENIDPAKIGASHWNLAIIRLMKGDLRQGFARYPARTKALNRSAPNFPFPRWHGEDLSGKKILIAVDQGHGDTLMLARYFPLLKQRGAHVTLQAQPGLAPYLRGWSGLDGILVYGLDTVGSFDLYANEFDLPRLFKTDLHSIPAGMPYLPIPVIDTTAKLPNNGKKKIALTWSGSPLHVNDHNRSVPLKILQSLIENNAYDFYALNRDKKPGDDQGLFTLPITDLSKRLEDFSTTARYIAQMDLVITCDTSIAHLAGGMGKPVWVMLPYAPAWCWGVVGNKTPWYPSARLFRQQTIGNWQNVVGQINSELKNL